MKTSIFALISFFCIIGNLEGQDSANDTVLIYAFSDAFSLISSDDESLLAVIIDNNNIEFYTSDSLKYLSRCKVSRNAWLDKAFFHRDNSELYYDYGMQLKYKYKKIDIATGEKSKIKCKDVPKGCGYKSLKYCGPDSRDLILNSKRLLIRKNDIDIEVFKIH